MLWSIDTESEITKSPHKREYDKWQSRLSDNMVYQMAANKDMQFKINLGKGLVKVTHSETDTAAPYNPHD